MNLEAARELSQFADNAYCTEMLKKFESAAKLVYGQEWTIVLDIQNRMQFLCTACNKEMNSVNAMADHTHSGNHIKMIAKSKRPFLRCMSSLQEMLQTSDTRAVGLQNVEELRETETGMPYFKCNLCGSHSKMEAMFKHLIGGAHTQNYVKLKFDVFPYLSSGDREKYTRILLDHEGSRIEDMRTIIGKQFYPYRWKNDVDPNFRKLFGDRTSRQIQSVDDGDHRGRNIGAARAFSKAVKETYTTRSDKLKKSRVDCTSLYSSCASLNSSDMAFEQIMLDGDDQIEKLMDHIYQEEKKEKGTDINPLQNEGYKVAAFKLMYILSVEEYEKTQADITKYDDSAQKMLLESHLKNSSKILGILQSKLGHKVQ